MWKKIFLLLLFLLFIGGLYVYLSNAPKEPVKLTNMPWQMSLDESGRTQVFGISLGRTSINEALKVWSGPHPDIGLFVSRDGKMRLEAYFGSRRIGLFDARVLAGLEVEDATLQEFAADRINPKPMPSGDIKQEISEVNLLQAYNLPIDALSYIPTVQYEADMLSKYFGQAVTIKTLSKGRAFWLYPDKGLAILLDPEGKEFFHYVNPAEFAALEQRLDSMITETP